MQANDDFISRPPPDLIPHPPCFAFACPPPAKPVAAPAAPQLPQRGLALPGGGSTSGISEGASTVNNCTGKALVKS
jgi:hypothetical protein